MRLRKKRTPPLARIGLSILSFLLPAAAFGQHEGMLTPPAKPQVAALADTLDGAGLWVLGRNELWRLEPGAGAPHGIPLEAPLTGHVEDLEHRGARRLPLFKISPRKGSVAILEEGGSGNLYSLKPNRNPVPRPLSPREVRRTLARDWKHTGVTDRRLWPEGIARLPTAEGTIVVEARAITLERNGESVAIPVPGYTYRELMKRRPDQYGKFVDPLGGVGPVARGPDGSVWMGLSFREEGKWTGVGGLLQLDADRADLKLVRTEELASRSMRSLHHHQGRWVAALGHYREGRWWVAGSDPPGETYWYASRGGLYQYDPATRHSEFTPALADPRGVEAPVSMLSREDGLWVGMGSGLARRSPEFLLFVRSPEGGLHPLPAATVAESIRHGTDTERCDVYLWLRRVRFPEGSLLSLLREELEADDAMRRALAASACGWQRESGCKEPLHAAFTDAASPCEEMSTALALGRLGVTGAAQEIAARAEAILEGEHRHHHEMHGGHEGHGMHHEAHGDAPDLVTSHNHSACPGCPSLNGEGPGGAHSMSDALLFLGAPAVPYFEAWLDTSQPSLRELGQGLRDMAARTTLPPAVMKKLRLASGMPDYTPEAARSLLRRIPPEARGLSAPQFKQCNAALLVLEEDGSTESKAVLQQLGSHRVLGRPALGALVRLGADETVREWIGESADPRLLRNAVLAIGERRESRDLQLLGDLLGSLPREGMSTPDAWNVIQAIAHVARYYGSRHGTELWMEAARALRSSSEMATAAQELASYER